MKAPSRDLNMGVIGQLGFIFGNNENLGRPGTSGKSGLFHVPSTELQYQAEVQLPEVPEAIKVL
jgi:hypothetical protein